MPHVAGVPAIQIRHPMILVILVKTYNQTLHKTTIRWGTVIIS